MTHDSATGRQGLALMEKYGVSTIPALVFLDGEGALICKCLQDRLRKDPTGKGFPWPAPIAGLRPAQVGFAIPPLAEVLPKKPTGKPPPFPQHRRLTAVLPLGAQWVCRLGAQWDIRIRLQSMQGRQRGTLGQSNSPPPLLPQDHPLGNGSTRRPYNGLSRHRNRTSVSATPHLAFIQKPW